MQRFVKYPPQVTLLFILQMILISVITATLNFNALWLNVLAGFVFLSSVVIIVCAALAFKRAETTIDATTPEKSSRLVQSGIYAYSRNPMYLGFLGFLVSVVCVLGNALNLLLLPLYILYMNKQFIAPEEQALSAIFKQPFSDYKKQVRRWI